jgi:urea transport system permease protein
MIPRRALFVVLALGLALAPVGDAEAQDPLRAAVNALGAGGFREREAAIEALARLAEPAAAAALEALDKGDLYLRRADGAAFVGHLRGAVLRLVDPLTGAAAGEIAPTEMEKIRVNNALRRAIAAALGGLTLLSPHPEVRRRAAEALFKSGNPSALDMLERAIAREGDPRVKALMREARAAVVLNGPAGEAEKLAAVDTVAARGDREALGLLIRLTSTAEGALGAAAAKGALHIERTLALWDAVQNAWYGLSLGSVLLLAAIGLAITFGVMGVINMAHGEMVMLGAYTAYAVQEIFRSRFPAAVDASLLVALPAAFLVAGALGVAIERAVIRFLYGRPLETLLATWGLSLILQQLVRSVFGPTNREVATPAWMSGSVEVTAGLALTSNRIAIIVFAALVFTLLTLAIRRTTFGLEMRAVTQNRAMADSVGIRSGRIDALTFGLGSAIAGVAGVALSQIDNVSPNLGQAYIIDSFLVVVFGGVGNLWGTLLGALSLGVANKFLEPYAGAVLGKILILAAVIVFIQKRPRGLFALKGRAAEA